MQTQTTRRSVLLGLAAASTAAGSLAIKAKSQADPLVAMCAEHDRLYGLYLAADTAEQRGEIDAGEFEALVDPILDEAGKLTDQIAASKAATLEGLAAQYNHFMHRMGDEVKDKFCPEWAAIFDSMQSGLKELAEAQSQASLTGNSAT